MVGMEGRIEMEGMRENRDGREHKMNSAEQKMNSAVVNYRRVLNGS
jgi:hypothetical protein